MTISEWKAINKNTLRGFFTVTLPSGLVIHKVSLHEKDGQRWIGMPAEKYTKKGGGTAYSALIEFTTRPIAHNFRKQALIALEAQGLA